MQAVVLILFMSTTISGSKATKTQNFLDQQKPSLDRMCQKGLEFLCDTLQDSYEEMSSNIHFMFNKRNVDLTYDVDRPLPENESSFTQDCLHDTRNFTRMMRPYPNFCYGKTKFKGNIYNFFHDWWYHYGAGFSYAFDFVLWDPNQVKVNQFWYLLLYLKTLMTYIDNPMYFLKADFYKEANPGNKVDGILKRVTQYQIKISNMEYHVSKMVESVSRFHADKIVLINQLNEIITNLKHYEKDKKDVEEEVRKIGENTSAIRYLINTFTKSTLAKLFGHFNKPRIFGNHNYPYPANWRPSLTQSIKQVTFPSNTVNAMYSGSAINISPPSISFPGSDYLKKKGKDGIKKIKSNSKKSKTHKNKESGKNTGGKFSNYVKNQVNSGLKYIKNKGNSGLKAIKESKAAQKIKQEQKEAKEKIKQIKESETAIKVKDKVKEIKDNFEKAKQSVSDTYKAAEEAVKKKISENYDKVKDTGIYKKISEKIDKVKDKINKIKEKVQDKIKGPQDKVKDITSNKHVTELIPVLTEIFNFGKEKAYEYWVSKAVADYRNRTKTTTPYTPKATTTKRLRPWQKRTTKRSWRPG